MADKKNIRRDLERELPQLAERIDQHLSIMSGESAGFMLIVFTQPAASFISNFKRHAVITALRKLLNELEKEEQDTPSHRMQ